MRTQLFVNFDEDDYSRLIRRMDHLERVVSEQVSRKMLVAVATAAGAGHSAPRYSIAAVL